MTRTFYGRIDLERLPPQYMIRIWENKAREVYIQNKPKITRTRERFMMEYVWNSIADFQQDVRAREFAGRVC